MSGRTYAYYTALIGAVCGWVVIRRSVSPASLTLRNALVQGFFVGFGLAVVTIEIIARVKATRINGWITIFGCGVPGNGMFSGRVLPIISGPGQRPRRGDVLEITRKMARAKSSTDGRNYMMHFPPGGLPPNDAFWSLTMGDARNRFVANPIDRYSVSNHSGLVPNADGSVDIYIQNTAPTGHESNWLPAPGGKFILWLRVYVPGAAILDGKYKVPPVVEGQA